MPNPRQAGRESQRRRSEIASEIGIGPAQRGRVRGEPPSDDEAGDRRRAGAQPCCRCGGLYDTGRLEQAACVSSGRRQDHCRKCCRAVKTGGIIDDPPDIVFEVQRVSPDEFAIAVHFPNLAQEAARKALSPRAAAKHNNIAAQERGARREIDDRFAPQAGAVEQDRLGRQEFESGAGPDRQGLFDRRRPPGRPIDLLGRGRGDMRRRSWCELDVDLEPVTGDEPARSRDDDRDRRIADGRRREQDPQRVALIEMS